MRFCDFVLGVMAFAWTGFVGCSGEPAPDPSAFSGHKSALTTKQRVGGYNASTLFYTIPIYNESLPECDWVDLASEVPAGTPVSLSNRDDGTAFLNFPLGFNFYYYGKLKDTFWLSANGYISFNTPPTGSSNYNNTGVYGAAIPEMIAPWWDDLIADVTYGSILTKTYGSTPNRTFVVQWNNFRRWSGSAPDSQVGPSVSFQVAFNERDSSIEFRYRPQTTYGPVMNATVGMTDSDPSASDTLSFNLRSCSPSCKESGVLSGMTLDIAPDWGGVLADAGDLKKQREVRCFRMTPAPHRYQKTVADNTYTEITGTQVFAQEDLDTPSTGIERVYFPTGKTFTFFGRTYEWIWVTVNGVLSFGSDVVAPGLSGADIPIPSTLAPTLTPKALLAPWWGNMLVTNANQVTSYYDGVDTLVIQYKNWHDYDPSQPSPGIGLSEHQLQVRLHFDSATVNPGSVDFDYGGITTSGPSVEQTSVGIQDGYAATDATEGRLGDYVRGPITVSNAECTPHCTESDWPTGKRITFSPFIPTWDHLFDSYFSAGSSKPGHCANSGCHSLEFSDMTGVTSTAMMTALIAGFQPQNRMSGSYYCPISQLGDGRPDPLSYFVQSDYAGILSWLNSLPIGTLDSAIPPLKIPEPLMPLDTLANAGKITSQIDPSGYWTRNDWAKRDVLSWWSSIQSTPNSLTSTLVSPTLYCQKTRVGNPY